MNRPFASVCVRSPEPHGAFADGVEAKEQRGAAEEHHEDGGASAINVFTVRGRKHGRQQNRADEDDQGEVVEQTVEHHLAAKDER